MALRNEFINLTYRRGKMNNAFVCSFICFGSQPLPNPAQIDSESNLNWHRIVSELILNGPRIDLFPRTYRLLFPQDFLCLILLITAKSLFLKSVFSLPFKLNANAPFRRRPFLTTRASAPSFHEQTNEWFWMNGRTGGQCWNETFEFDSNLLLIENVRPPKGR